MDQEFHPKLFQTILQKKNNGLKTRPNFRDILGEQFALMEGSGDPNLTYFILHFHVSSYF